MQRKVRRGYIGYLVKICNFLIRKAKTDSYIESGLKKCKKKILNKFTGDDWDGFKSKEL